MSEAVTFAALGFVQHWLGGLVAMSPTQKKVLHRNKRDLTKKIVSDISNMCAR